MGEQEHVRCMIGERVRVARARAKMTMADVAKHCGCSAQAVKKWEHGEAAPSSSKLLKICELLDVSMEWLMAPEPLDFQSSERAPRWGGVSHWRNYPKGWISARFQRVLGPSNCRMPTGILRNETGTLRNSSHILGTCAVLSLCSVSSLFRYRRVA